VLVGADQAAQVFDALPTGVRHTDADLLAAVADDQVRLWWDDTPIDLFFAADPFHAEVARRCRAVPFAGRTIRVLGPDDLAVFKALFDRPKDWVDIATMRDANTIAVDVAADRLAALLGPDDSRIERLRRLR